MMIVFLDCSGFRFTDQIT